MANRMDLAGNDGEDAEFLAHGLRTGPRTPDFLRTFLANLWCKEPGRVSAGPVMLSSYLCFSSQAVTLFALSLFPCLSGWERRIIRGSRSDGMEADSPSLK